MKWEAPNIWNGEDCFIIGGGHSISSVFGVPNNLVPLQREEFISFGEYLKPYLENEHVIGVNLSAFIGDWVGVAYWGDSDTYLYYKNWFDDFSGLKVSSAGKYSQPKYKSIKYVEKDMSNGFCTNKKKVTWVGLNSGAAAINLAYHLGAKRIFLLGFDMYSLPDGRIHWHSGYPDKKENFTIKDAQSGKVPKRTQVQPKYKRQISGFGPLLRSVLKKEINIEIINLSPKSKVKEFPIASFWDYFDKHNPPKKADKVERKVLAPITKENENKGQENDSNKVNFVCVLRSGGDFSKEYVFNLYNGILNNYSKEFNFYCLTDVHLYQDEIIEIPLKHDWSGWWSKIELFRPDLFGNEKKHCIYFDLDTVILDNIDEFVEKTKVVSFGGLRGFNQTFIKKTSGINFASGIMVGDFLEYAEVYNKFKQHPKKYINKYSSFNFNWRRGDQGFIFDVIKKGIQKIQDLLPKGYIAGKMETDRGQKKTNAKILAWSGRPRLHKITSGWVHDRWSNECF